MALAPRVLLMIALFPVMSFLVANPTAATLVAAVAALSFLQAMSAAVGVILIPLIFPPAVRSTGLALTYSLGVAIFGGTATYVVTWLVGVTGDPLASSYYVMAANVVMAGCGRACPRRGRGPQEMAPAGRAGGLTTVLAVRPARFPIEARVVLSGIPVSVGGNLNLRFRPVVVLPDPPGTRGERRKPGVGATGGKCQVPAFGRVAIASAWLKKRQVCCTAGRSQNCVERLCI